MRQFLSFPFYAVGLFFVTIGIALGEIGERIECPAGSIPADTFLDR